jgi:hypothetical protein
MKHFGPAILAAFLAITEAQAKTYQWTYTGGDRLLPVRGFDPIKHVRRLLVTLASPTPFPKSTCFDVPQAEMVSLTDGHDTLQTLEAAGFALGQSSDITLCTDATGKAISSWTFDVGLFKATKNGTGSRQYVAFTQSTEQPGYEYFDSVAFYPAGRHGRFMAMQNASAAGSWKLKVIN